MAKKKTAATTRTKKSKTAKASPARRTSTAKPKAKAKPKTKAATGTTVDGVLKSFEKERVGLNDKLVAARKKVEQLAKQIDKLKGQLEDTRREIVESDLAIATLDARRDKEIGVLLSGLGVDLGKVAAAAKPKPAVDQGTPLFDKPKAKKSTAAKKEKDDSESRPT